MKGLLWGLAVLVVLAIGVGVYLVAFSGDLLKQGIETYGPQYLGADVQVDAVDLSLADGSGEVRGLRIGNPRGFEGPDAMRMSKIKLVLDTSALSEQLVILKHVEIDGAQIAAIAKGKSTNLQQLVDNASAAAGLDDSEGPDLLVIIDRLDFTNAKTSVNSDVLGEVSVDIPDVHLKDVGRSSNGIPVAQAVKQLMDAILKNVSRALVAKGLDENLGTLKSNLQDKLGERLGGGLKGLRERFGK